MCVCVHIGDRNCHYLHAALNRKTLASEGAKLTAMCVPNLIVSVLCNISASSHDTNYAAL